ncbi:unnamed protein product [Spirodela intermedia]|uniref:Dof zinc finger protein n=1 Tax=Spirodela intermedia TaxID=51605 RepID=A0A7I8KJY4_SPIIN|nr:unnamed protein product [Spirodela intermedia]
MWDPPPPLAAAAPPLLFRSEERNLRCPRCQSTDTKFCYYNNYNLAQPRHFCRSCRRYWTKGGSLRNIPVGGGSRRNTKRVAPSPSSSSKRPLNPLATAGSSGEASDGGWVPPLPPPPPPPPAETFVSSQDNADDGWDAAGGWPDLVIYSHSSNFQ